MNPRALCATLLALLAAAAPALAQRDTIRIRPAPVDSLGVPLPPPPPPLTSAAGDTIFDAAGTRALVERVIRAGSSVPPELLDYRAEMRSAIYLSVRPDSAPGGELPVTVDEFAGQVRWERGGALEQRILGHRIRLLAPTPYTVGTLLESPWVVPHLYGNTIDVFQFSATRRTGARLARAVHPFSFRGIDFYRYATGDTIRVRTREGTTTLVPVEVRRRPGNDPGTQQLVAGTFWVDVDRAAVARARFGFLARSSGFRLAETGLFFELESGLVEARYWLPYRQRREIQVSSPLLGGAAALRLVTTLSGFDLNTGWRPDTARTSRLVWALREGGGDPFAGWRALPGEEDGGFDIADFADLRDVVRPPDPDAGPIRVGLRWERTDHLFRYNRVEGPFLGAGVRVEPRDPDRRRWELYGTGGWAFAEGTARGEATARWRLNHGAPATDPQWTLAGTAYRRLPDTRAFRPILTWDLGQALGAALGGYDVRDYYDARGGELSVTRRRGGWTARLGGRWERQDSVGRNTERFFFGEAEEFPLVAPADPGDHAAAEAELRFARGAGAFGIGNSLVASVRAEQGFADFRFTRVIGLLTARRDSRYLGLAGRVDAGWTGGEPPPQFLFRFGGTEGLRGYERNAFGGTTAAAARGRLLLHLPPYGSEPLLRLGFFAVPPLRPSVVLSGEAGWADVREDSRDELLRLGSFPTDGAEASFGVGLSIFEDAVSAEYVRPVDGGEGRWYVGFVQWF